jgi:hypothetical protein
VDLNVLTYLLYFVLALPLTLWVARALHRYGMVFLVDVFNGDEVLSHAVNQLLVIGFYLFNLGYVALFMTSRTKVDSARRLLEVLSTKVGAVAIVVGVVHFANVWAFNAFRRRAIHRARVAPPAPQTGAPPAPQNGAPLAAPYYPAAPPPQGAGPQWPPPAWPGWTGPGAAAPRT